MDNDIGWAWNGTATVTSHVEMRSQSIEDLTRVRKIGLESVHICRRVWKGDEIQVQDFVTLSEKVGDHMATSLSAPSCKHLRFCQHNSLQIEEHYTIFLPPVEVGIVVFDMVGSLFSEFRSWRKSSCKTGKLTVHYVEGNK
jgi:hypothetical protein